MALLSPRRSCNSCHAFPVQRVFLEKLALSGELASIHRAVAFATRMGFRAARACALSWTYVERQAYPLFTPTYMIEKRISRNRRLAIGAPVALAAAFASAAVFSQTWPTKPIKLIVPFPPGGATDVVARTLGERLQSRLGQPVVIDNRPGASTMIGATAVAKAPPDGYTLLLSGLSTYSVLPALKQQLTYDAKKDLAPVAIVARTPLVLVVGPATQVKSLAELITLAKSKPNELTYSTFGTGSVSHLAGEMFSHEAGVKILPIPYKGGAPATMAAISGEVNFTIDTLASATPHIKAGKLRALAIVGVSRVGTIPDVPTMAELNFPGSTLDSWYGVAAPVGTPAQVLDTLSRELAAIVAQPEVKDKLLAIGVTAGFSDARAFAAKADAELQSFTEIGKRANITLD